MDEQKLTQEVQAMLPEAVSAIKSLYVCGRLGLLQTKEQEDQAWSDIAEKYTPFALPIVNLLATLYGNTMTSQKYPQVISILRPYFKTVSDGVAQDLLANVLLARITTRPGYISDNDSLGVNEARRMATELGADGDLRGEQIKTLTLDSVVEKVLTGNLKLTRQT